MNELTLKLTINELNQVLNALGEMPYQDVYLLLSKIQQQAHFQLSEHDKQPESDNMNIPKS